MIDNSYISGALEEVGLVVSDVYELVNSSSTYEEAIPLLVCLLDGQFSSPKIAEGVVRALGVKGARGTANRKLFELYSRTPRAESSLRWAIGNSIFAIVVPDDEKSIEAIVLNCNNGISRQMFVASLGKIKTVTAEDTLIELLDDPEVALHAISALRKHKSKKAKSSLERILMTSAPTVRKAALKYLTQV